MKTFLIESQGLAFMERGWGNGYVIIPKGHPAHGLDYYTIHEKWDIDVHYGLTFAQPIENFEYFNEWSGGQITPEDVGSWVVGFDTAHYRDSLERWPMEAVFEETQRLREQLEAISELSEITTHGKATI